MILSLGQTSESRLCQEFTKGLVERPFIPGRVTLLIPEEPIPVCLFSQPRLHSLRIPFGHSILCHNKAIHRHYINIIPRIFRIDTKTYVRSVCILIPFCLSNLTSSTLETGRDTCRDDFLDPGHNTFCTYYYSWPF